MSDPHPGEGERIAKAIARAGLCSRREAEALILAGRVAVNGQVITSPALDVTARDRITVDGEPLPQRERTRLFLYHKPRGLVTTSADPEGRATIFEKLPKNLPRLISVGRLDINSEGLLLLTNDGGLARTLKLPQTAWLRRYRVRAHGNVTPGQLTALRNGITVDGIHYGSIEATLDRPQGSNVWITFAMREGKNREVRNVMRALGLQVNRLIRVSYGPFQLGELPESAVEEVPTRHLREQIGERIATAAGAEFSGPITPVQTPEEERRPTPAAPRRGGESPPSGYDPRGDSRAQRRKSGEKAFHRGQARGDGPTSGSRRDRTAEQVRGRLPPRKRGEGERTRFRPDKSDGTGPRGTAEKPRKRRSSPHHVWREEGKPVRSKFRGARAERRGREHADKGETGVLADRKGRAVTVVRVGSKPKDDERSGKRSRDETQSPRAHARNRRGFDRRSGPRPSRPRER
jgi:23S rRNA pseudouridine2605 synthase